MNKFATWLLALCACVCVCACSSNNEDEPTVELSTIAGKWNVTAYKSGATYTPATNPEYYEFTTDGKFSHVYVHAADLIDTTTGVYTYDRDKHTIHVDEPRGWNLDIAVTFLSTDGNYKAIFDITGRTATSSKTIKVERE